MISTYRYFGFLHQIVCSDSTDVVSDVTGVMSDAVARSNARWFCRMERGWNGLEGGQTVGGSGWEWAKKDEKEVEKKNCRNRRGKRVGISSLCPPHAGYQIWGQYESIWWCGTNL